jgi:hypothetical protein
MSQLFINTRVRIHTFVHGGVHLHNLANHIKRELISPEGNAAIFNRDAISDALKDFAEIVSTQGGENLVNLKLHLARVESIYDTNLGAIDQEYQALIEEAYFTRRSLEDSLAQVNEYLSATGGISPPATGARAGISSTRPVGQAVSQFGLVDRALLMRVYLQETIFNFRKIAAHCSELLSLRRASGSRVSQDAPVLVCSRDAMNFEQRLLSFTNWLQLPEPRQTQIDNFATTTHHHIRVVVSGPAVRTGAVTTRDGTVLSQATLNADGTVKGDSAVPEANFFVRRVGDEFIGTFWIRFPLTLPPGRVPFSLDITEFGGRRTSILLPDPR